MEISEERLSNLRFNKAVNDIAINMNHGAKYYTKCPLCGGKLFIQRALKKDHVYAYCSRCNKKAYENT